MLDLGYSQADLEKVAATKIQNMIRGVLGKAWLRREKVRPSNDDTLCTTRQTCLFARHIAKDLRNDVETLKPVHTCMPCA
jgi:hypothetical protein